MSNFSAREFEVSGHTYTHLKLDAFTQLHASRKGAPLFVASHIDKDWYQVLYSMRQEDLDFLVTSLCPFIRRRDDVHGGWAPIYEKSAKRFLYEDIDGGNLIQFIFEVLTDYLPDFIISVGSTASLTATNQEQPIVDSEASTTD